MSYRNLLKNLKALPSEQQILAAGKYIYRNQEGNEECGCVLGKGLPKLRERFRVWNTKNIKHVRVGDADLDGMTLLEAREAQLENDGFHEKDYGDNERRIREARYVYMIEWLEKRVKEEQTWQRPS